MNEVRNTQTSNALMGFLSPENKDKMKSNLFLERD